MPVLETPRWRDGAESSPFSFLRGSATLRAILTSTDSERHRLIVQVHDLVYDYLYAPVARGIMTAAERLNALQFLTIRQYLSLVFCALVSLLTVLAIWP